MTAEQWEWHTLDRRGEIHTYGTTTLWGDHDEQRRHADRLAADRMALLLYNAEPHYELLAGWRVRVWSNRVGYEAVAEAEEWLASLRRGPLARMRDRVELLPRLGARR